MTIPIQAVFLVKDQSFVGATRRSIRALAEQVGLSDKALSRLDIITTELATNLVKHAQGKGEIFVFEGSGSEPMLHLLCIDNGIGIKNIDEVLLDGVSTRGTLGCGLGAIQRQSDYFEISSELGKGTVVHCAVSQSSQSSLLNQNVPLNRRAQVNRNAPAIKISPNDHNSQTNNLEIMAISVPRPGEQNCGDGFAAFHTEEHSSLFVVDGLGHGDEAAKAAALAVATFSKDPFVDSVTIAQAIHGQLAGTRGAAMALIQIDYLKNQVSFVGVGNISCRIHTRFASKGCVSSPGIVGSKMGSLKQYDYDWGPDARLLAYSDGIKSSAQLGELLAKSAVLAAGEIYRDYNRATDDTTVVVAKDRRGK